MSQDNHSGDRAYVGSSIDRRRLLATIGRQVRALKEKKLLLYDDGAPSNSLGSNGDSYLDLDTALVYTKTAGDWGTGSPFADPVGSSEAVWEDLTAEVTVADLLAGDPFYIAHRGSGAVWPEHTLRSYSNAVAAGAKAIEVSCHLSADGVLFCMHDTTLDRMTNSTWTGAHSTWTMAELQERAKIVGWPLLGNGWADQTIPTLREVLDRFLGKVVIFLEAKSNPAVVPLQNLLLTYPNAPASVVWKNYYTSSSFTWAKSHGFTVWGYTDATTTMSQMDAVQANIDIWGVPIEATDAQFQAVLGRTPYKEVITWAVWRRAERDRVQAFSVVNGGTPRHVKGMMCSQYPYVTHATSSPILTTDNSARWVVAPGDMGGVKDDPNYAMKFDQVNGGFFVNMTSGQSVLLGSRSCMVDGATGYKIRWDMMFPVLPAGTLHAGIFLGQVQDNHHRFAVANTEGCYRVEFRPNSGALQLYTVAAGAPSGVQVGTDLATAVVTAGQWASFEAEITGGTVTIRRTDSTGWSKSFTDSTYRGRYFGAHNGSLTDLTTVPRFRDVRAVAV